MLNEHDLADWDRLDPVPLYKVKNKTFIDVDGTLLFMDHIDGMFSYCLDFNNNVVHLSATSIVIPLNQPAE